METFKNDHVMHLAAIFQNGRHKNTKLSMFCIRELYKTPLKLSDNNNQVY